jgi:hypothetical protein
MRTYFAFCGLLLCGKWLFILFVATLFGLNALASGSITVSGSVTDPSGRVITPAELVMRDLASEKQFRSQTNAEGQYKFEVPAATYELTLSLPGFEPSRIASGVGAWLTSFTNTFPSLF